MQSIESDVLIVGAGPVGLTLAIDLAQRGVRVTIAELRRAGEPPSPKCNHVAARTMEIFRRLGIVDRVRNAGLPADYPNDISYRTTFTGLELTRIRIPCRRDRYADHSGPDGNWPTPEPPHRINQTFLEPILFDAAASTNGITILDRTRIDGVSQSAAMVLAQGWALDSDTAIEIRARFMVGCDGGSSNVRRWIGAKLEGDAVLQRVQSTYIEAPDLIHRQQSERAWATFSLNPRRSGNVYAIDGRSRWLVHHYLKPTDGDFDEVDRDGAIRQILGVGPEFRYDVISKEDWFGRRLIADRFRDRRIFICGDAAHIWVPYAGFGMNAGIADATNLAWMLAAHIGGWAPYQILDAHEAERWPITDQVSRFAMNHAHAMARQRGGVPPEIEDDTPAGAAARTALGKQAYDLNVQQYCAAGLNFGYYYDRSPIIAYDGEEAPSYTMSTFTASTVPGCRAPHVWLADGTSLYDRCGSGFAVVRQDRAATVDPLLTAAARRGVSVSLIDVDRAELQPAYRHALVVIRPDQHVAWRGDALPPDPVDLIDKLTGRTR